MTEQYLLDSENFVIMSFDEKLGNNECVDKTKSTITLTYGDQAENHVGMQKIGKLASKGFTVEDLENIQQQIGNEVVTELISLNNLAMKPTDDLRASVLIIRKGVDFFLGKGGSDNMFNEQRSLDVDKQAFMYGRVVNKHARHNLCFGENSQDPDYEKGKGRIVAFDEVPLVKKLRETWPRYFGQITKDLMCEANYYYDAKKCGIGAHGDSERKIVIGVRLGCSTPLHYHWFLDNKPTGKPIKLTLHHGDVYLMSEKTTGNDWKRKNILTLRHAAGADKYLKFTK